MTIEAEPKARRGAGQWRTAAWSVAILLLLLPLVAMQFTGEVNWSVGDFIFAALLIGSVGLAFELTVRLTGDWRFRGGVALALAASFLTVWVNGAVGMIGSEENAYNLLFLGVIVLALLGSVVAGFRARGMALAIGAAALAQASLGIVGAFTDLRGGIFATMFAGLWLLSAALFSKAGRKAA